MILDDIVALFGELLGAILNLFFGAIDLLSAGIEFVLGIFLVRLSLPRILRKGNEPADSSESRPLSVRWMPLTAAVTGLGMICLLPFLLNRQVSFVAADGHGLPYAEVIIQKGATLINKRTDREGNLTVPRFGVTVLTIKSPRYVEQSWQAEEIGSRLIVQRTILGSGLDKVARALLLPARE